MRLVAWIFATVGVLLVLVAMVWFGYGLYVQLIVAQSPSTMAVVHTQQGDRQLGVYRDGNQVVPLAPSPTPLPVQTPQVTTAVVTQIGDITPSATPLPRPSRPILPPTRLSIPKIGVDASIVLADNSDLPRFKGIGWYLGTGYPGFRGNMVLFGHVNGIFETFARLAELTKGDIVTVEAMNESYEYRVTDTQEVPESDVAVLAPTSDERVTLITCSGTFYPVTRDYSNRLVVIGTLVARDSGAR